MVLNHPTPHLCHPSFVTLQYLRPSKPDVGVFVSIFERTYRSLEKKEHWSQGITSTVSLWIRITKWSYVFLHMHHIFSHTLFEPCPESLFRKSFLTSEEFSNYRFRCPQKENTYLEKMRKYAQLACRRIESRQRS